MESKREVLEQIRNRKPQNIPMEELTQLTGVPTLPPDDPLFRGGSFLFTLNPSWLFRPRQEFPTKPTKDSLLERLRQRLNR